MCYRGSHTLISRILIRIKFLQYYIVNDDLNSFENPILESVHNITYENRIIDKDDFNSFEHPILESDHNNRNEGDEDSNECPFGELIRKDDNNMV